MTAKVHMDLNQHLRLLQQQTPRSTHNGNVAISRTPLVARRGVTRKQLHITGMASIVNINAIAISNDFSTFLREQDGSEVSSCTLGLTSESPASESRTVRVDEPLCAHELPRSFLIMLCAQRAPAEVCA